MTTKESILALFEEQRGVYFSGEEIAARLAVSRAAVWKAVNSLRTEGYEIDAVPNKGYRFAADTDMLSIRVIKKYLDPLCRTLIYVLCRRQNPPIRFSGKKQTTDSRKEPWFLPIPRRRDGEGEAGVSILRQIPVSI